MPAEQPIETPDAPDSSDVITGDIGGAHLRDPATSGPEGADLEQLPIIPADEVEPPVDSQEGEPG